jgi:hypothetical protein
MKLTLQKVSRRPGWPLWAIALTLAWLGLIATGVALSQWRHLHLELCLFKYLTHLPCPTCGSTRAVLAILHGQIIKGFAFNPLAFVAGAIFAGTLLLRTVFRRAVRLELGRREKTIFWLLLLIVLAINWAYLIAMDM